MRNNLNNLDTPFKKLRDFTFPKKVRRFKDEEDGVTMIEFAMLAGPFFMLFMAIIECSLLFFAGQMLESAVDTVGRQVRVGILDETTTEAEFKTVMCTESSVLFDCDNLKLDLQVVGTYADLGDTPEPVDGDIDDSEYNFTAPGPDQIIMITATYEWPVFTNYMASSLSDLNNGNALLMGVAVFRSEPYG